MYSNSDIQCFHLNEAGRVFFLETRILFNLYEPLLCTFTNYVTHFTSRTCLLNVSFCPSAKASHLRLSATCGINETLIKFPLKLALQIRPKLPDYLGNDLDLNVLKQEGILQETCFNYVSWTELSFYVAFRAKESRS